MAKFSILLGTCLNDRIPVDPLPTYNAVPNPVAFVSLGDWLYHDGTSNRNALALDAVEFPRGSGLVLQLPAAVGGVIPTGALTVTNGGSGHPINRSAALFFWVRDPITGATTAHGMLTTNGTGVVTAANLVYGGRAGDYSHTSPRAFTEDTDLWTWAHPESWAYRSRAVVTATTAMRKFMQLPLVRYLCPDDHEYWNGGFPGAFGTKAPTTVTTQDKAWEFAQTCSAGVRGLIDQDFHNPAWADPVTAYVPSGLSGRGLSGFEPFFKVRYFSVDITSSGRVVTNACGTNPVPPSGTVIRLILLDCLFEKGNYQVGSDDSNRNLISPIQEAWFYASCAVAKAAGVGGIRVLSSKDRHGQNSDGFWSHTTQFARMATAIQTNDWPVLWQTGDRHIPHAARWRVPRNPADMHIICATALGATSEDIVMYPEMDWSDRSPDSPVMGSIVVDTTAMTITDSVHDMATGRAKYAAVLPFGSRIARWTYMAAPKVARPVPSPLASAASNLGTVPVAAPTSLSATNAASYNGAKLSLAAGATLTVSDAAWPLLTEGLTIVVGQSGSATLAFSGTATKENAAGTSSANFVLAACGVYRLSQGGASPRFRLSGGAGL